MIEHFKILDSVFWNVAFVQGPRLLFNWAYICKTWYLSVKLNQMS